LSAVILLTTVVLWNYFRNLTKQRKLPPGPSGLPIIGLLPFLGKYPPVTLNKLAQKYGPLFRFHIFGYRIIVLGDYETVKKAYIEFGDIFASRPASMVGEQGNIVTCNGTHWREQRRFALSTLRDYGVGRSEIEPRIVDEIQYFLQAVACKRGQSFDIHELLAMSVCNNICVLEFGKRFEYSDPEFIEMDRAVNTLMRGVAGVEVKMKLRTLRKLPVIGRLLGKDSVLVSSEKIITFIKKHLEEQKVSRKEGERRGHYVDAYMAERKEREKAGNYFEVFTEEALAANLRTFFIAGTETTTTALRWGILFMTLHPDVQRKVQREIDDVIGREATPSWTDRADLPYTEATLLEVQRRGSVVPLNLPHCNTEEVTINGYVIPERSLIISNLWAIHHDPKLFPDPETFRPERFINEKGQAVKPDFLIPFSVGKRFCLGEPLARMELFLYFTAMLQKFTFLPPEGDVLTLESNSSLSNSPLPYKIRAVSREE
jgi:cytochrome P450 family 2 subfamily J